MTLKPKNRRRPHLLRILLASLATLLLPLSLSSAALADDENSPKTWTVQVGSESSDQAIQGMFLLPSNIYVNAGDKIKWEANSAEIHTVTFPVKGQPLKPFNPFDPQQLSRQAARPMTAAPTTTPESWPMSPIPASKRWSTTP
jgi:plastocyanin